MVSLFLREIAQFGRALGLGPRGRRFESSSQHYKDSFRLINLDLSTFYEDKLRLIFLYKEK